MHLLFLINFAQEKEKTSVKCWEDVEEGTHFYKMKSTAKAQWGKLDPKYFSYTNIQKSS